MYYAEYLGFDSKPRPTKLSHLPSKRSADGKKNTYTFGPVKISEEHRTLSLVELQRIYSNELG